MQQFVKIPLSFVCGRAGGPAAPEQAVQPGMRSAALFEEQAALIVRGFNHDRWCISDCAKRNASPQPYLHPGELPVSEETHNTLGVEGGPDETYRGRLMNAKNVL